MSAVPDSLPTLASGKHRADEGKACVMEYCSVITGSEWTDLPACTNRIIAKAAQAVNDNLHDDERYKLVPFIGRLIEAGESTAELSEALFAAIGVDDRAVWRLDWVASAVSERMHKWYFDGLLTDEYRYDPQAGIDMLSNLLDIHERMTGRTPKQVDPDALNRARTLIETGRGLI